ncbi:MAG: hypothetical protein WCI02_09455 [Planctomycetota bacterium]
MSEDVNQMQARIRALEKEIELLKQTVPMRGIRKRSETEIWGLPLYDIATGPDPARGEIRGHARGIIAIGDLATGFIALGGMARGFIAIGGGAIGIVAMGGGAIGLVALGGGAIGLLALGGAAIGFVAFGGGAIGYYAGGGGAIGKYVLSATEQNPEAIRFFKSWIPGIEDMIRQRMR